MPDEPHADAKRTTGEGDTDERGFTTYATFRDTYGAEVIVRESSSAMQSRLWIFVHQGEQTGAIHLDAERARWIIGALQRWLDSHD